MDDKELDEVVKLKNEIKRVEGTILEVDCKLEDKESKLRIGYKSDLFSSDLVFDVYENREVLEETIRFYKSLQYLKIKSLAEKIKKIMPSYEITNPTILKAIKEANTMREECINSLGEVGKILFSYS